MKSTLVKFLFIIAASGLLFAANGCKACKEKRAQKEELKLAQVECVSKCDLAPEAGTCKAYFPRYYYDKKEGKCKEFIWGGCEGVVPFNSLEECEKCDCSKK